MNSDVPDELSLGVLCFIVSRAVETEVLAALGEAGFDDLTQAQGRVCARIGEHGTRIGDLAEQAQVTKQTATTTVDLLERKGYVRRVPDPTDARATLVVPSPIAARRPSAWPGGPRRRCTPSGSATWARAGPGSCVRPWSCCARSPILTPELPVSCDGSERGTGRSRS